MSALRRVCVHEYAHLVTARHFGAAGFVRVLRLPDAQGAPRYAGRFQMHGELDDDAWRVVALAGVLGECIDDGAADDPADLAGHLRDDLQGLDAELACGYGLAHVDWCLTILRAEWRVVQREAEGHADGG